MEKEEIPDSVASSLSAPFAFAPARICRSHWMAHLPFAFWLIDILRPRLFVELGAYEGASFCAFCQEIARLGLDCEAYAVDTWQGDANMGSYGEEIYDDLAAYIKNNYQTFACLIRSSFDDALSQFEDNSIDLLHIDGFHGREAMLGDFEKWLPKMSTRGVVLMHDTRARLPGYGGVSAWKEISERFPSFVFNHGYGLGMVLPGKDAPAPLQELTRLSDSPAADFRTRFQRQASIYEALFNLWENHSKAVARAEAEQENLQKLLNVERENSNVEREKFNEEREKFKEALLHSELKAQALEGSLSWKITAPLRKMARFFRS